MSFSVGGAFWQWIVLVVIVAIYCSVVSRRLRGYWANYYKSRYIGSRNQYRRAHRELLELRTLQSRPIYSMTTQLGEPGNHVEPPYGIPREPIPRSEIFEFKDEAEGEPKIQVEPDDTSWADRQAVRAIELAQAIQRHRDQVTLIVAGGDPEGFDDSADFFTQADRQLYEEFDRIEEREPETPEEEIAAIGAALDAGKGWGTPGPERGAEDIIDAGKLAFQQAGTKPDGPLTFKDQAQLDAYVAALSETRAAVQVVPAEQPEPEYVIPPGYMLPPGKTMADVVVGDAQLLKIETPAEPAFPAAPEPPATPPVVFNPGAGQAAGGVQLPPRPAGQPGQAGGLARAMAAAQGADPDAIPFDPGTPGPRSTAPAPDAPTTVPVVQATPPPGDPLMAGLTPKQREELAEFGVGTD